jgi:hypothetical protein
MTFVPSFMQTAVNAIEVYGKLYVEKVREAVNAAKADQSGGKLSQGEYFITAIDKQSNQHYQESTLFSSRA